jgi:prepilin-type processing-associated H-X9-DG protein
LNNPLSPDYAGPGWIVLIQEFIGEQPDGRVFNCPAFPDSEPRVNYFLGARWMYTRQPMLRTMPLARIRTSSRFVLAGECTARSYYPPPFGTSRPRDDIDKDDGAIKCLLFKTDDDGFNMHRAGNNVLFADGHVAQFNQFDPASLTYSAEDSATWESLAQPR